VRARGLLPFVLFIVGLVAGLMIGRLPGPSATTVTFRSVGTFTVTAWETLLQTTTTTTTPADFDGDGIPDQKEIEYGTDPGKPNYLFSYALRRLPESEALKFRYVEYFDEASKGLVDLYASLPQSKRGSVEVSELLDRILADNVVDRLERDLFEDRFVNPSPPSIVNLSWRPLRENLDKVYDIEVTFAARDDKTPIAYAELRFTPVEYHYMIQRYGMRPEDYPKVFPPDKERTFILEPVDGKFDSLEEAFKVQVKDIVGGREYRISILVRDLAGNQKTIEVKTPYIRQFENMAKSDDIIVGVLYLLWWGKDDNWKSYRGEVLPLLGKYSSKDSLVINKHIDWATGHGVDLFFVQWSGIDYQDEAFKNYFLDADLVKRGDIKFAILYETIWRLKNSNPGWNLNDAENVKILDDDILYLSRTYFSHPSYFKIQGKPVLYIYESKGFFGNISQIKVLKDKYGLFLISDHAHPLADPQTTFPTGHPLAVYWGEAAKQFDAIMPAAGLYDGFLWYRNYFKGSRVEDPIDNSKWIEFMKIGNEKWSYFCDVNGLIFIPSVSVGISYKYSPWGNPEWPRLERDPQQFKERFQLALKYLNKSYKILFITEFNNFFEEAALEPDSNLGFSLLLTIKNLLTAG
jgi:hypothetical protein